MINVSHRQGTLQKHLGKASLKEKPHCKKQAVKETKLRKGAQNGLFRSLCKEVKTKGIFSYELGS